MSLVFFKNLNTFVHFSGQKRAIFESVVARLSLACVPYVARVCLNLNNRQLKYQVTKYKILILTPKLSNFIISNNFITNLFVSFIFFSYLCTRKGQ